MKKEARKNQKINSMTIALIVSGIVILVLIIGALANGRTAGVDTQEAVRNVSLMYLDELSERWEQVVSGTLDDYISDINTALSLMEKSDLESKENLQVYQAKMKQLYDLEKYAFVDEDGLIYTAMGTRNDIDKYGFDPSELSEPEIYVKNPDGNNEKVIIAVPVDHLPLEGKSLVACFMEIDMERLLDGFALKSSNNNTTFCNIYTSDGKALTNLVLGGLASEDNLLEAMGAASFEKGFSIDEMKEDFSRGRKGVVSFVYNDIRETMYYVPVRNTDWMLTYLIRESVISQQINSVSDMIIRRTLIQSVITAMVLIGMFLFVIFQTRRNARLNLEKRTAEVENQTRQEGLEEQLALQEELLEQEKARAQQDRMITALASDYKSVYYVDLDTDEGLCYQNDPETAGVIPDGTHFPFKETFAKYADMYVAPDYREEFIRFIETDSIRKGLASDLIISYRYLVKRNDTESFEMLRIAGVRHPGDRKDHMVHAVGVGFSNIDAEMRDTLEKSRALRDALKTAEEASKAKTVFLSNMSHEIRTPMNAIIGLNAIAMSDDDISDRTRGYLEKINSSAQHLLGLINDILDMSRIESGKMILRNDDFSLPKLIDQVNTIFNGQCQEKTLSYNCSMQEDIGEYYTGDSIKLKQVLINILSNAVKFTPPGGSIYFDVKKTGAFAGKTTLQFTIRDTGIGMNEEYIPRIFDTFSQEDSSTTNKYGSSGLGMAITRSIVEMMSGNIKVDSKKGVGTTFTVAVTLLDSVRDEDFVEEIEIDPADMRTLVVDDDPVACDHARLMLESIGISSETVLSGEEAVKRVKEHYERRESINLIIVDWRMPDMDGMETVRRLRDVAGFEPAILMQTSYNKEDVLELANEAGVDGIISKPLLRDTLLDELRRALKKHRRNLKNTVAKADLAGRRILLAEDMKVNADIMVMVLQMRNMEVDHAENGRIAVEKFVFAPDGYYDAVLMDMRMPEMDGLEATRRIRSSERLDAPNIPIIALTANAFEEDTQRSLQAGLNAHLSKPVEPEVLFETLEHLIGERLVKTGIE